MAEIVSEMRPVSGFDCISLRGMGDIEVVQGGEETLRIEAREDILPRIRSEVRDGQLVLEYKSWLDFLSPSGRVKYTVGVKSLRAVEIGGSGNLSADSLEAPVFQVRVSGSSKVRVARLKTSALEVDISGSSHFDLAGECETQRIQISGSGHYDGPTLASREATVKVSGAGDATLKVSDKLDITVSGSGTIRYLGEPKISQHISGSATIKPAS